MKELDSFRLTALAGIAAMTIAATTLATPPAGSAPSGPVKIEKLGGPNAFHKPPLASLEDLRMMAKTKRADLESVLMTSGWPGQPEDVLRALETGHVDDVKFPVGGEMQWMAMRRKGKPDVIRNAVWAGKEPFDAFQFTVVSADARHTFLVPKKCGNLAFLNSTPLPPPVARISASPASACLTTEIKLDASSSSAEDAKIGRIEVEVTHPGGKTEKLDAGKGFLWNRSWDPPGTYKFTAVAYTESGRASAPATASVERTPCPPTCSFTVSSAEELTGVRYTIDGSGSTTQVGSLKMVTVQMMDGTGAVVSEMELEAPFATEMSHAKPGMFTYKAVAIDSLGQKSTNACGGQHEALPRLGFFADALAGTERRWRDEFPYDRSAPLIGVKLGPVYKLRDDVEVAAGVGVAFNTRDNDNSSAFADVELNWIGDRGLLGAGVGVWDFNNSETITGDLLIHGGLNLPWKIDRRPVLFLIEGRLPFDHASMIDNNYVVWGGLRFYF